MFIREMLLEEAAPADGGAMGTGGGQSAGAPPAYQGREPSKVGPSLSEVMQRVSAHTATTATPETAQAQATAAAAETAEVADAKSELKKLPEREKPKVPGARERIAQRAKDARAIAEATEAKASLEGQLQAERDARAAAERRTAKLDQLKTEQDIEAIVKEMGYESFEAAQTAWLQKRGALPKENAQLNEALAKLQRFEEAEARRAEAEESSRRTAELEATMRADREAVAEAMRSSGYERLGDLAEKPFAVQFVYQQLLADDSLDEVEAYRRADSVYKDLWEQLNPIYGGKAPPVAAKKKAPPVASAVPQQGASQEPTSFEFKTNGKSDQRARDRERGDFLAHLASKFGTA